MSEVSLSDLIGSAADQSPETFRQQFDQLMHDKVVAALDVKKQDIASRYFAQAEAEDDSNAEELDTDTNEEDDGKDTQTDA